MFDRQADPEGFGRIETVTALAAQSVTVAALAVGTLSESKYQNKYLWRPDSTSVLDRQRMCSAWVAATGKFTQAGSAYTDTTVDTEQVGISEYEVVGKLVPAVNLALRRLRRRDIDYIPANATSNYWLGQFSWITAPGDVEAVFYRNSPVLSRNRWMAKWPSANATTASATALPEWFTLTGSAATARRITTNVARVGQFGVEVIAGAGAAAVMTQTVGLLNDGVSSTDLQGKEVTTALVGRATAGSTLRAWYSDDGGTTKQYTSYHTGDSLQQELSSTITVSTTASNPTFGFEVAIGATAQVSDCYLVLGTISDSVRRDSFTSFEVEKQWDQSGQLMLVTQNYGIGSQIEIHSKRNYPTLSADTDTCDAPLTTVAVMALRLLYRGLASASGQDNKRYKSLEEQWSWQAAALQGKHYASEFGGRGVDWPPKRLNAFPTRVG